MKKFICVFIIFCFVTTGCGSLSQGIQSNRGKMEGAVSSGATGGSLSQSIQSNRGKIEGTVCLGAIGGLLGYIITLITGGDSDDAEQAFYIGMTLFALAGYAYGSKVDRIKAKYAIIEKDIDDRMEYVQNLNQITEKYNQELSKEIEIINKNLAWQVSQYKMDQLYKDDLIEKKRIAEEGLRQTKDNLGIAKKELTELKKLQESKKNSSKNKLDIEISNLESYVKTLQNNFKQLEDIKKTLSTINA